MNRKNVVRAFLFMTAAVLLLQGCSIMPEEEEVLDPPVLEPEAVEYTTQEVERGDIANLVNGSGTIASTRQYALSFPYRSGYIKDIHVQIGDTVKKGQLLAELDTDSLEKDIEKKELEIEKIKIELDGLKGEKSSNELERKQLQLDYLRDCLKAHPEQELDLNYQIRDLELQIEELKQDSGDSYQVKSKEKDLEIAKIELEDLKMTREKSRILSPCAGKIVFLEEIGVGDYIAAQKVLMTVADPAELVLEYTGTSATKMKVGMPVTVTLSGQDYEGEVVTTPADFPLEEQELRKETVFMRVDGLPDGVEIGDSASFEVVLESKQDVLIVPKRAVMQYMGTYTARVLSEDGIRTERDIEVGIETATQYEVISGLEEGEVVILE